MDYKVKIGFAPTRRRIFSPDIAVKFRGIVKERLDELGIDYVDIDDINEEGLLRCAEDVEPVVEKFKKAKVDALFLPHCNFGSEHSCAKTAAALGVPVLLWGPRDEPPNPDGSRPRDTQCGLFATGKVLRRMNVPFTYLPNCHTGEPLFEKGLNTFIAAANVVKEFRRARILQIDTRPADFWTMMCNEGELLEKFGIQLFPVTLVDLAARVRKIEAEMGPGVKSAVDYIKHNMEVEIGEKAMVRVAALKCAIKAMAAENGCNAVAIQCWDSLQDILETMPCCANAMLTDEGLPVVCETDIHGAITSIMVQAAGMGKTPSFFVDWTLRHPTDDNGELLQHCGPWPLSLMKGKARLITPFAFRSPGSVAGEIRGGEISLLRFDGDHGDYSMLMGTAEGMEGPAIMGTYLWAKVPNWPKVEAMIVKGPYVHHATAIHGNILPVINEALNFIPGIRRDFYDEGQKEAAENFLFTT